MSFNSKTASVLRNIWEVLLSVYEFLYTLVIAIGLAVIVLVYGLTYGWYEERKLKREQQKLV